MENFFIDIKNEGKGVKIDVGSGGNVLMSRSFDSNPYDSLPPTFVAFAAFRTDVDFEFCLI